MANLKEIRNRIASVKSTRQITSAMKMVSASKLRRSQDAILQLRPYANKLQQILERVSAENSNSEDNPFAEIRETNKVLIILISSNKGLCGAFNSNVVKLGIQIAQTRFGMQLKTGNLHFLSIGKKAGDILKAKNFIVNESHNDLLDKLTFENSKEIAEKLMNYFTTKKYDKIILIYNQFKNAASQIITEEQFLPLQQAEDVNKVNSDYIFEPSKEYIIKNLIPDSLRTQFFKALLDSHASENGARMTAMHQATDNASEMIKDLTLNYNKARQATITNEILEIVSGANALKS